jgi:MFS family permease
MKHVFMSALSIFLVGNIVCATAPSSIAFIIGRAICGFGNAGMLSGCTMYVEAPILFLMRYVNDNDRIISRITSLRERPLYSSISGGIECIAIIIAPLLSGAITHSVDWRVCFYIIIPFVVIMLISTFLFVDVSNTAEQANLPTAEKIKQLDLPGMMIFTPLIVSFTLALQWGGTEYAWRDGRIIALLVIAGVFTIIFAIQQWRMKETATLSPPLLKERTVTFGCLFMFTTSGSGYVIDFYVTLPLSPILISLH